MNTLFVTKENGLDKKEFDNFMKDEVKKRMDNEIKCLEQNIESNKYNVQYYLNQIKLCNNSINDDETKIARIKSSSKNTVADKLYEHIVKIINYRATEKVTVTEYALYIYTKTLYINEPIKNKRYLLGEMKIAIPTNINNDITFENLTGTRDGYGTCMHHPHIFSDGYACLGTFANSFYEARANEDYFGTYLLALNFCRTVDINDEAGAYIGAWDEVDENGNIICEGTPRGRAVEYCAICEDEIENGGYICSICDRLVCFDCMETVHNGEHVCRDCLEEEFEWCSGNEMYFPRDEVIEINGEYYHEEFVNNNFTRCEECGEYVYNLDVFRDENGNCFCSVFCSDVHTLGRQARPIENELTESEEAALREATYEVDF